MTLAEAISQYLKESRSILTDANWHNHFRALERMKEYMGEMEVSKLTWDQDKLRKCIESIKDKHNLNEASVYGTVLALRKFMKYCVENEWITTNVHIDEVINFRKYADEYQVHFMANIPEAIYPLDEDLMRRSWINPTQSPTLINVRNAMIVNILFDTGIRVGELTSININDFNSIDGTLKLKGKTPREVHLSIISCRLLIAYLSIRKDYCKFLVVNHTNSLVVSRLSSRTVQRLLESASSGVSSLVKINPNRIRQSYTAKKFAEGLGRDIVKKEMGYRHYSTSQLSKFSIHFKAKNNNPNLNVNRYLEDFETKSHLKNQLSITKVEEQKMDQSKVLDRRIVTNVPLLRESEVIEFIDRVKRTYKGLIPVAVRLQEWKMSRDLFVKFKQLNPDTIRIIDKIWYVNEDLNREGMISKIKLKHT